MNKYLLLTIFFLLPFIGNAYPIDGYKYTGIDRLLYHYRNFTDSTRTKRLKDGAFLMMEDIKLQLLNTEFDIPEPDPEFEKTINRLFYSLEPPYSISVLDFSNPQNPRYASRKDHIGYQPGSVGKLIVAIAFFDQLHEVYGDDWDRIHGLLNTKVVKAGQWAIPNHHTIPFYDVEKDKYWKRHVVATDEFTLYEWLDHMLSISSNAAASIVMRETLLLHLADRYYDCMSQQEAVDMIANTPRAVMTDLTYDLMNCPLWEIGIDENEWRLGGYFTRGAENYVGRKGGSIGTTRGLLKFLVAMEQGKVVNEVISLELKRLMYMTDRRIRYAASGALKNDAVYFKSGSLYSFKEEPGFVKRKYAGNRYNYMNSVAIVEKQDSLQKKYMVVLMSNVLRKNSVNEHYGLAYQIDKIMHQ